MKLIIDSKPVNLEIPPGTSFENYCTLVMNWLMERNRSISSCRLDNQPVIDVAAANAVFNKTNVCEIESVPLRVALQSTLALQCNRLRQIEEQCENLVTECLLAEPKEIARLWKEICDQMLQQMAFIPRIGGLLTDEQIDHMVDQRIHELNEIMKGVANALSIADVVTFSDALELQLIPWVKKFREFLLELVRVVEALPEEK